MEELIKFRHFAESMSQDEFEAVMPEICETVGKDLLISLLYEHFQANPDNNAQVQQINHQLAVIANRNQPLTEPKLDKISQPLINNICSYLSLTSYTKFERCNRAIFIAARSPVQLYYIREIDCVRYLRSRTNHQTIDANRFSRVKSLNIGGQFIPNLIFGNLGILYVTFNDPAQLNAISSNLQFLDLYYKSHPPTINENSHAVIKQLLGLSLTCREEKYEIRNSEVLLSSENDLLNACSSELQSFHTDSELSNLNFKHVQFPNLTELCLRSNYNPNIANIIATFKQLKRLRFNVCGSEQGHKIELTTKFMNTLLGLTELESIDFSFVKPEILPKLLKLIQNALMIHRKKKLKIYIFYSGNDDKSVGCDLHIDLEVFVNSLQFLVSDFMFMFMGEEIPESQDANVHKWVKSLKKERFRWSYKDLWDGYFIVANKGCKINTCQREWIMKCDCCESATNWDLQSLYRN